MDTFLQILATLGTIAIVLFCNLWWSKKNDHKKVRFAPEVAGGLPFIGHLHLLAGANNIAKTFASMAEKHGPIFSIRLGVHPHVVISNYELVKELFTTNDRIFSSRTESSQAKYLGYNAAGMGFAPYGSYWRNLRKVAMLELLSIYRLKTFRHYQVSEVNHLVNDMFLLSKRNEHRPVKVVLSEWVEHLTLNVITLMITRKRFFESNIDANELEDHSVGETIREFMDVVGCGVPGDMIPFLGWFDYGGIIKRMKRVAKELDTIMEKWLQEHKSRIIKSEEDKKDFIDVLLSTVEDDTAFGHKRDTIVKATVLGFMVAGSDTSAITMTWAFSNMLNNRRIMELAQEQLDQKIGRDRLVDESEVDKLTYIEAIIKETLRLHPPGPLAIPHQSTEECYLGGYYLPKGTRLFVNFWKLQRDPKLWSNPEEFIPERFLTTKAHVDVYGQHYELLPFSSGRRACPGINLAMQVMKLTLARLLQAFNFYRPSEEPIDMTEGLRLALFKETPLEVMVTPRLALELYDQQ